jgi:hypothetical protein
MQQSETQKSQNVDFSFSDGAITNKNNAKEINPPPSFI